MAERARELVASLLNDKRLIDTIANACSSSAPSAQPSFDHVEGEVRSLFNRGPQIRAPEPNACNVIHTNSDFNLHVSGMSYPPPLPSQSYNLRRLPRVKFRRQTRNRQVQGPPQLETFTKEVVLLPDNTTTLVPRRANKAWLFDNGHVKSAVEFNIEWGESQVMSTIQRAFMPRVDGCSLQLLMGCHSRLVKPSLAPHQEMSGRMLKKVFHQRSVYVQPDKILLDQSSSESGEESPASEIGSSDASSKNENENVIVAQQDTTNQQVSHILIDQQSQDRCRLMSDLPEEEDVTLISQTGPSETVRSSTLYSEYVNLLEMEEYEPEDASLQEAIANSLSETSFRILNNDCPTIEDIMRGLNQQLNPFEVVRFNIIRRNVWDGATRAMTRPNFSPDKTVDVKFTDDHGISEGAVDNGGPTREFFRLCLQEVKDSCGMFEGPPNMKTLSCNSKATRSNWYFLAGQLMAMSVVHGGQSPAFLSPVLFNSLVRGPDNVKVTISDVPDVETSQMLQSIKDAKTDKELLEAVTAASCLISLAGCNRKITLTNKEEVCTELAEWYVLQRTRAPFERFRDGLQTLGVLDALQKYPERFKGVFMKTAISLTASAVEVLFKCKLAERGSNRFESQCRTLGYWRDYLQDAEVDIEAVTLEEILVFTTGCDSIPSLGFSPLPSLEFENSAYPTANTCDNILRVPIKSTYEEFKLAMDFGIRNAAGFGKA